jgi:RNA polymerase sigma-70 factor (ECF subfamily)
MKTLFPAPAHALAAGSSGVLPLPSLNSIAGSDAAPPVGGAAASAAVAAVATVAVAGAAAVLRPSLEELYREHAAAVARWAARLAGPGHDVEDLVQEVFLAVERRLPYYRGESRMTTWLYGVTENVVRYTRRKQRWRGWLGLPPTAAERLRDPSPGPAEQLDERRSHALVYAALADLPEKYRTVLILFELEGLSGEQISELTGAKLATVWTWLHRGRQKFLEQLVRLAPDEVERRRANQRDRGGAP